MLFYFSLFPLDYHQWLDDWKTFIVHIKGPWSRRSSLRLHSFLWLKQGHGRIQVLETGNMIIKIAQLSNSLHNQLLCHSNSYHIGAHTFSISLYFHLSSLTHTHTHLTQTIVIVQGYWRNHLAGRKYHISAIYVVDLVKFRQIAAGDRLRGTAVIGNCTSVRSTLLCRCWASLLHLTS